MPETSEITHRLYKTTVNYGRVQGHRFIVKPVANRLHDPAAEVILMGTYEEVDAFRDYQKFAMVEWVAFFGYEPVYFELKSDKRKAQKFMLGLYLKCLKEGK